MLQAKRVIHSIVIALGAVSGIAAAIQPAYSESIGSSAPAAAERMLQAIGGRTAWAALRNTINGSEQYRTVEPTVVYSVITIDFERPRLRIETIASGLHLVRVVDGQKSWRINRAGEIADGRAETVAADRRWYAAHLYRTIHRIAARDGGLQLEIAKDGRLEVHENGERLLWFRLDANGEPYAFGVGEDETGSLTGPWNIVREGIHHPAWVTSADGTWRAAVKALNVNVPLRDSMFDRPNSG